MQICNDVPPLRGRRRPLRDHEVRGTDRPLCRRACARRVRARAALLLAAAALILAGCEVRQDVGEDALAALRAARVPAELATAEDLFNTHCSICHGRLALGTRRGPPLVHPIYAPGHHADAAFHLAVHSGVRAHHFRFGDMPPVPEVTTEQVPEIVAYVRWLQRTAGIE